MLYIVCEIHEIINHEIAMTITDFFARKIFMMTRYEY